MSPGPLPTPPPFMPPDKPDSDREMTFLEHLDELRSRVIKIVISLLLTTMAAYCVWRPLLKVFTYYPLRFIPHHPDLIYTAPVDVFMMSFKIALGGGCILAFPFVIYQVWSFVAPGLYRYEKSWVFPFIFFSTLCFLSGAAFAYFVIIPIAFKFLLTFSQGIITPMLTINAYMGFIITLLLALGAVFELPVLAFVLAKMGLITSRFLLAKTRYAIVAIFIVAAILTPPDVVSQILMALPLLVLYFISILVVHLVQKKKVKDAE